MKTKSLHFYIVSLFVMCTLNVNGKSDENITNKKFSFGLNFSPDNTYRRLHSDYDNFVEFGNKTESARFGFTTGMVSCYQLSFRFALESGLQFSDKGFKYEATKQDFYYGDGIYVEEDPAIPDKWKTIYHNYYLGIPLK